MVPCAGHQQVWLLQRKKRCGKEVLPVDISKNTDDILEYGRQNAASGMSDGQIAHLTTDEIRALLEENEHLRSELRIRDNDILSHDQVFDSIVSGALHLILVMSVTSFTAEFVTTNIETALGLSREEVKEDVRRIGTAFENIEQYNGKEEIFIHRTSGARRTYLIYVIHLPYGRSDRVAVVLLCRSDRPEGVHTDLEDLMIRQTQDANRVAGYFLASMSHDFRVPINSISGFVVLLMKNAENPAKVMEYAHRIGVSCQEILTTVDQILDMTRIETGDTEIESEEFGLGLMLEEVSSIITSLAKARDQQYIFSAGGIEHDIVLGDKARIMEMLRGILSNAVKFTPPGGRVELSVSGVPDENEGAVSLVFEVRDTGVGMDRKQLDTYFYHAVPSDSSETKPGRGTGIWLTRKLAAMMNGSITAQSAPGEGTIVWIRLRLRMVNSGVTDFWEERGIRRMLIVNNNLQEAARIRNLMESAGVDAMSASSGYGTLKLIEHAGSINNADFDLILLDEELQDMDWREVVASIQAMTWIRKPVVFLMTGRQLRDEERRGSGVSHVMQKPFYVSALHRLVEQVFARQAGDSAAPEEDAASMAGMRFLAAEDNAINADLLRELLEMSGARCEIAGNGRAALAMFSNSRPGFYDAILMDLQMPVMDGYAAACAIRALDRGDAGTIPILAMTGATYEDDVKKTFEAGMDAHITKPIDIRLLAAQIHRLKKEKRV